jgi:hypothetical protein
LLGYFDDKGHLIYAGRVGTGMSVETLGNVHEQLKPLATPKMPLAAPPPRKTRFGGPRAFQSALGPTGASCGDHVSRLDRRAAVATYCLCRPPVKTSRRMRFEANCRGRAERPDFPDDNFKYLKPACESVI